MITHIRGWRSYSTTGLLTPLYSMGFCAGICLGLQLVTGFVLACWYQPVGDNVVPFGSGSVAFKSVDSIQRELDAGCMLRSLHANGASIFMGCVYVHMIR